MKPYIVVVFAFCIISAFAQNSNSYLGSAREVLNLYNECSHSDGLSPCLQLKALSLIDRVGRMEKITLMDGVVITGKPEQVANQPSLEDEEKNLPRSLDAKSQALTSMIYNRIARMIGSKSIEISIPKFVESARKGEEDSKFGDIAELLGDKFGGGGGGDKFGGGGGGGGGGGLFKNKKKKGGDDLKDFLMQMMAHKIAMIPLLIGGLFILAVKALTHAKIALLISGIIFAKKLLASKSQGGGGHVEHVQAGWSGGGSGGWSGGSGGWSGGSGGGGGWDKRSLDAAQDIAYNGQKPT